MNKSISDEPIERIITENTENLQKILLDTPTGFNYFIIENFVFEITEFKHP